MLLAARHQRFFSLVGIRTRYTFSTNLNYPFAPKCNIKWRRKPYSEPHQSKAKIGYCNSRYKCMLNAYIYIVLLYSINYIAATEYKRARKECLAN